SRARRRSVPPALRRALTVRDRGCRFPGCGNERFLDAHHIEHWARGGETSLDNLLLLCRRHHRLVHEGGCGIERDGDGELRFRDRGGFAIPSVPRSPPAVPDDLRARNRRFGLAIAADTCSGGLNERMDLGLAVDSLLGIVG
ncbi:MAG: HNH endonuclease, partial [Actinomycetota bacterium]|nr:HNH endonuclease [Actinomycetota bacterium]